MSARSHIILQDCENNVKADWTMSSEVWFAKWCLQECQSTISDQCGNLLDFNMSRNDKVCQRNNVDATKIEQMSLWLLQCQETLLVTKNPVWRVRPKSAAWQDNKMKSVRCDNKPEWVSNSKDPAKIQNSLSLKSTFMWEMFIPRINVLDENNICVTVCGQIIKIERSFVLQWQSIKSRSQ